MWSPRVIAALLNPNSYRDPASFMINVGMALFPHGWVMNLFPLAIEFGSRLFGGGGHGREHIGYNLVANPKFKTIGEDDKYIYYTVDSSQPGAWEHEMYRTEFRINKETGDIDYKKSKRPWVYVDYDALPQEIKDVFGEDQEITPDKLAQLEKEIANPAEGSAYSPELIEAMKDWQKKYLRHGYQERKEGEPEVVETYGWAPFEGQTQQDTGTESGSVWLWDPRGYGRALYYDVLKPAGYESLWEGDAPPEQITPDMYNWSGKWYEGGAPDTVPEVVPYYLKIRKGKIKGAYGAVPIDTTEGEGTGVGTAGGVADVSGGAGGEATGGTSMGKKKEGSVKTTQSREMPSWGEWLWDYYKSLLLGDETHPGVYGQAEGVYGDLVQQLSSLDPHYLYMAENIQKKIGQMDQAPVGVAFGGQHIGNFVPYAKTTLPYIAGYATLVDQYQKALEGRAAARMAPTLMALAAAQGGFPTLGAGMGANINQSIAVPKTSPSTAQQVAGWANVLGALSNVPGVGDIIDDVGGWIWGEAKDIGKSAWNWLSSIFS